MKYYAQFYNLVQNANGDWSYQEGCGDRQIIRIDGRHNIHVMLDIAADECRARKYDGYRLGRGNRIDNLFWLTAAVWPLPPKPDSSTYYPAGSQARYLGE